jgi:hypothetical protein
VIERLARAAEQAESGDALAWTDFFVAEAGAAAALAGLVVVAVSINVERILASQRLIDRARLNIAIFVNILLIATFGLIPVISDALMGGLLMLTSAIVTGGAVAIQVRHGVDAERRLNSIAGYVVWYVSLLPLLIGGVVLITGSGVGLAWVSAGIAASFVVGMLNAWVLLVEILR